jgi:spermidine synthase
MPLLVVALVLSGAAGLTYQILWLRLLSLSFGVTTYAASTVLAGFMAGLALGSLAAGRVASRATRPLALFAAAECAIAVTALGTLTVLNGLPTFVASLHRLTGETFAVLTLARFIVAFLVLVVPTTFMGATLPLVAASRVVRARRSAARLGAAYAANTAGAIAGALVTGFVLVGGIGIRASFLAAAACNLAAAVLAFALSRAAGEWASEPEASPASLPSAPVPSLAPDATRRTVLTVLAISGLASLALEIVWFRVLTQFITATTYAFTTMLAAVLGGIAAGGWMASWLLRRERDWLTLFLRLQAATAIAIVASLTLLAWTYQAGWRTGGNIQASVLAILPATLLMGMSFPIGIRLWSRSAAAPVTAHAGARESTASSAVLAGDVGVVYAANVCGAIAGAVLGGFVLLPALGSRASLIACAGLYLLCALGLARVAPQPARALRSAGLAAVVFAAIAVTVPDPFLATLARRHGPDEEIVWREEGVQTSVSVHRVAGDGVVLYLDGLHQANDTPSMLALHRQIGHLPMVLHHNPRRALVIGLGGGATAGAVSRHPGTTVDVVELSDSVRKAASLHFAHANDEVLAQPNVRLRVDDGRNFLLRTEEKYDVITADIIQPIHAGAGLLYSVEYFALARRALAEGGLMLQWVGHRPDTQYKLIVRSFREVFPHATAWLGGTLLVGSTTPLSISRRAFDARRSSDAARQSLDGVGLDSFETLLSWYAAGPAALGVLLGEGPILTDDRPQVEYHRSLPDERGNIDLSGLVRDLGEIRVEP